MSARWRLYGLVFLSVLATSSHQVHAGSIVYMRVHREVIQQYLKLSPPVEADRVKRLHSLFQRAGCAPVLEQTVAKETLPNVICVLPGSSEGSLVVGAAINDPSGEANAGDRWETLAMLPLLAESLAHVPHRTTIRLVAFTGHEHGMRGARWFLDQLSDSERKSVRAMVNLDDLGKTPAVYVLPEQDRSLALWLEVAAHSLRLDSPSEVNARTGDQPLLNSAFSPDYEELWGEAKLFVRKDIPGINIRSADKWMLAALKRQERMPADVDGVSLDINHYENTYQLLSVYLLYLDGNLGRPLVEPGTYRARIVDVAGQFASSPIDFSATINQFSSSGELNRYELILRRGGQDALAEALANEPDKGSYRFGLNLSFALKIAAVQSTPKGSYVLLVGTRPHRQGQTARDYRFTVIRLNLDNKGDGEGSYFSTAKLSFNKKHELELEDHSQADPVIAVRLEPPGVPQPSETGTTVARSTSPTARGNGESVAGTPARSAAAPAPAAAGSTAVSASELSSARVARAETAEAKPDGGQTSTPTFRAQARLVQVDVSVTDKDGHPIPGLKATDFTVLEDGKAQEIRAFEAHVPSATPVTRVAETSKPALPPYTYTNKFAPAGDDTPSIFLLDLLNTPLQDQSYARKQTIDFLKDLPSGKRIAMFVLASRLMLVQDFSDDREALVASAEKVLNDKSMLLTTEAERQDFQGLNADVGRFARPSANARNPQAQAAMSSALSGGGTMDLGSAQARTRTNATMEATRTSERVTFTLEALAALSRAVAGYPGRKNLIWLSGSFPVRLRPFDRNLSQPNRGSSADYIKGLNSTPNFEADVRRATMSLTTARIAVYPIDVRGILTSGVDISLGSSASTAAYTGTDKTGAYAQNLNEQSSARYVERSSMKEVAEQTGGEVLAGNDIRGAIGKAVQDGSTYYTLAYTPAKEESDPGFRRIEVKVAPQGARLFYRRGYYPDASGESAAPKSHPLVLALQPGLPPATVIPLTVEVLPPDATSKKVRISYSIDIGAIDFQETAEHRRHAVLDCIALAFQKNGQPVGQASNTMDVTLSPAEYESTLRSGLVTHQELELPAGQYQLRLGVMDHHSEKIGTLDVPLVVAQEAAQK